MKLNDKFIFILSLARFGDEIESTNFTLAKHLAKNNKVFYIENPYTIKDIVLNLNSKELRMRKNLLAFGSNGMLDTSIPNLKVIVTPPLLSINWLAEGPIYRRMLQINERIILHRINRVIATYKIKNYIFINSFNFYYPGVGKQLSPDLSVYHCVDPLVYSVTRRHGLVSEQKLLEESNLVICTSKKLYDEKVKLNKNTFFIPNAADLKHSAKAMLPDLPVHEILRDIRKPIVGYFGNIERRFDFHLLDYVTDANRDLSFVFTGPVSKEHVPSWFYERPNIYLMGSVPYNLMPAVLKGYNVAIIPFKKDQFSDNIFPLKLFEYLGAGKPVVSTDFNPDLKDFTGSTVAYCNDVQSFSEAIKQALYHDTEELMHQRLAIAEQNTWDKRADEFSELINKFASNSAR